MLRRSVLVMGALSVASLFLGFILLALNASDEGARIALTLLAFFSTIFSLVSAIFAIITGTMLYHRIKSRDVLWGIILGVITIILFIISFITIGGTPAFCINQNACSILQHEWACYSYPGSHGSKLSIVHPGFCAPVTQILYM